MPDAAARAAGGTLLATGVLLVVASWGAFRRAGTPIDPRKPTTALVTTGLHRFSRNPIYVGLTVGYAGIALLTQSWWAAGLLPVVLVLMQVCVVRREERYLERTFGEPYRAYKARVRRWV